jgi:polysaccharide export outer membrane protein
MYRKLLCALAAGLFLVGCATANPVGGPMNVKAASLAPPDPIPMGARPDYRLGPSDVIEINIFEAESLSRTVQVTPNGSIILALIGEVQATGKTASELGHDIAALYGAKYLQSPQVSVLIKQARQETYTVDGSVTNPGVFPISDHMSLIKAIATAKGTDQLANPKQVVVFRVINNERKAGVFDLTDIRNGKAVDPPIYPNDVIVVASSGYRRTLRDILGVTPLVPLLMLAP